jgi:23S rRNA U2552 (ribose-2'-O)-methylase RlmE/FtsJ
MDLQCIFNEPHLIVSSSLSYYINTLKKEIRRTGVDWDVHRKYTNPYEYINTSVPDTQRSVAKHKPLSRSYFKMIEIVSEFKLIDTGFEHRFSKILGAPPMHSFHLAEGPGGFIEALAYLRKNPNDVYIGMTLQDEENHNDNIPAWKKTTTFLRNNPNVFLENGATKTGDILSAANLKHCISQYSSSMELITADGGFDFTSDYDNQEVNITRLLFGQICFAVCMQKQGGHFLLKIFDSFMAHTADLIYLLSAFYTETYITKPNTSRYANSERYIVCKGFKFASNESFAMIIYRRFVEAMSKPDAPIGRFFSFPIPLLFMSKLEEYNAMFGHQQIDTIQQTIALIDNRHRREKIDNYIKIHTQKCISWCAAHNVPHNMIPTRSSSVNWF